MDPVTIAVLVGGGYLFARSRQASVATGGISAAGAAGVSVGSVAFAPIGPNSDPRYWYEGIKPGTVQVGGQDVPAGKTGPGVIRSVLGVGSVDQALQTAAIAMQFVPVVGQIGGAVIAAAEGIKHMLSAHHQAALATEGKTLNDVAPRMIDAMVLVLQGILTGELTSVADAQQHLDQIVADYYASVKSIQRGTWHYTDATNRQDGFGPLEETYANSWKKKHLPSLPDPCNAACLYGHYFAERNRLVVLAAVKDALAGNHGIMVFEEIPAYATQKGLMEVTVVY